MQAIVDNYKFVLFLGSICICIQKLPLYFKQNLTTYYLKFILGVKVTKHNNLVIVETYGAQAFNLV